VQKGSQEFMKGMDPSGKQTKELQNMLNKALEEAKKQQQQ